MSKIRHVAVVFGLVAAGFASTASAQTNKFQSRFHGNIASVFCLGFDPEANRDLLVNAYCQEGKVHQPGGKPQEAEFSFIYVDSIDFNTDDFCVGYIEGVDCSVEGLNSATLSAENITLYSIYTGEPCFTIESIEINLTGVGDVLRSRFQGKFNPAPGVTVHTRSDVRYREAEEDLSIVVDGSEFPMSSEDCFATLYEVKDAYMEIVKP